MTLSDLPRESVIFNCVYLTPDGKAYRLKGEQISEVKYSRIGKNGHVIFSAGGQVVYLSRAIYSAFVLGDASKYYDLKEYRLRYKDDDYSNCHPGNLYLERKGMNRNKTMSIKKQTWLIRKSYCLGEPVREIAEKFGVSVVHVRALCAGFDFGMVEVCDGVLTLFS